jgi:hypothetical protein
MATTIGVHKQKKKFAYIFIKNVGTKHVKRDTQLIKLGRKKYICRERERVKRKERVHNGTLKRRSVFCINPEGDAR